MDFGDLRFILSLQKQTRTIEYEHQRINLDEHIDKLVATKVVKQRFRMPFSALKFFIEELCEPLTVSCMHSMSSTSGNDMIFSEVIVLVSLQILGCGDTHSSLANIHGLSDASVYHVVEMFLDAVDKNESFQAI